MEAVRNGPASHCSVCAARVWDGAKRCPACGASLEHAEPTGDAVQSLIGRRMGDKFVLREVIGTGATGHVFRADQTTLGRTVAVKVLREHLASDPEVVKRFHDEALAASRLNHPNTVAVIDYGQTDDGRLYIAMEYLRGRTLTQILRHEPRMPLGRAVALVSQVLDALEEAHAAGVVHADLKSDNIMVEPLRTGTDLVKVVDFGIARIIEAQPVGDAEAGSSTQEPRAICGTPEYMAPEVILGADLTGAADQYGAAVVLYELIAGVTPFAGGGTLEVLTKQLREPPPPIGPRRPDLVFPEALEAALQRALAKDPVDRFPGVAELRAALQAAVREARAPAASLPDAVVRVCPACGAKNPTRFKFCPECGERVDGLPAEVPGAPMVSSDPRTETMRWAPPQPALFPLPMVGHSAELTQAETFLAGAGASTTMLITGAIGAGATRLVHELYRRVGETGTNVIIAGPDPSGLSQTFYPLRAAVAAILDLPPMFTADVVGERLEAAGLSHRDAPGLTELMGEEGALSQLDVAVRRRECFAATLRVLRAAAWRGGRAALIFEDVDEYDPLSIELLHRLAEHPLDTPVRVLLTAREGSNVAQRWPEGVTRVLLQPLEPVHLLVVAEHLRQAHQAGSPDADTLMRVSDGVPARLEHAVRHFFEGGDLASAPVSLPDLIALRLARLPASVRVALQAAAVLGHEAPLFALQRVCADEGVDEADLTAALGLLATHGLVELDGDVVAFGHPLVRDVVYDAMPADVRRALHRSYAETLPAHVTPTAILGHHAEHAGLHDLAVVRLLAAGDEAERHFDDHGAATMYQRALACARRALGHGDSQHEPADRLRDMLTAAIKLAEALRLCGNFTLARGVLDEASLLCDGSHRALEAQLKRAQAHLAVAVGAPERALAPVREAIGLAMTTGSLELLAALYLDAATVHARRGEPAEAARELLEGIDFVTVGEGVKARSGPRSLWRMAVRLAELQLAAGQRREAIVVAQHALRHALRAHSAVGRGRVNTLLASLYEAEGDLAAAERHRSAAIEEMRLLGDRRTTAELLMAAANTGQMRVNFDGLEEAQVLAAEIGWDGLNLRRSRAADQS
jgi:tetratricopeptide (TPR) repeat protein